MTESKKYSDPETTIEELKQLVKKFSQERNWQKHHTPKNLAMSIAIEAAELMEHYQWERQGKPNMQEVADELSDILFNVLNFAAVEKIDIASSFIEKYEKARQKYPVEKFNKHSDDPQEYRRIKQAYRAKKQ